MITIRDSINIDNYLSNELAEHKERHSHLVKNPFYHARELIKKDFAYHLEKLKPVFHEDIQDLNFIISIQDDLAEEHVKKLGSYSSHSRSTIENEVHFSVSTKLVMRYLLARINNEDEEPTPISTEIWLHELVHYCDSVYLKSFTGRMMLARNKVMDIRDSSIPPEWHLLYHLSLFRSEGIAMLTQHLMGEGRPYHRKPETAQEHFRQVWNNLIIVVPNTITVKDELRYESELGAFKSSAYLIGEWMVVDAMREVLESNGNRHLYNKAVAILTGHSHELFNWDELILLLQSFIAIDLGEFLRILTKTERETPWGLFIEAGEIFQFCSFLRNEPDMMSISTHFTQDIVTKAINQDKEGFFELLGLIIGGTMSGNEIEAAMQGFRNAEATGLEKAVEEETEAIYQLWLKAPEDKVLQYTLTYILDEQDLVQDDMAYIGLIDDWYVLMACRRLIE